MKTKTKCQAKVDNRPCKNSANPNLGKVCGLHKNWTEENGSITISKSSLKKPTSNKGKKKLSKEKIEAIKKAKANKKQELLNAIAEKTIKSLDEAIEAMENGDALDKWEMPWRTANVPLNVSTGRPYTGSNWLYLSLSNESMFATYKQYQAMGLQVRKLEEDDQRHNILVPKKFNKKMVDANDNPIIDPETGKQKIQQRMYFDVASVFSIHDTFNIDEENDVKQATMEKFGAANNDHTPIKEIEDALGRVPATIKTADNAYYRPSDDSIYLPPKETFDTIEAYYATMAHEMIHWTGNNKRLGRETMIENRDRASMKERAKEELVAEMGSSMLAHHWGIEHVTQDNHNKYLISWREQIKDDPEVLSWAANEAKKAVEMVLSFEGEDH